MLVQQPKLNEFWGSLHHDRRGPTLVNLCFALLAIAVIGEQFSVMWYPTSTSLRTTMKLIPSNSRVPLTTPGARGCGRYAEEKRVGHFVGASIRLAAGSCWNGRNVRPQWGLHRGDCSPSNWLAVRVEVTCRINGGHNGPMSIVYVVRVESSLIPIARRTVVFDITVTPAGQVLQDSDL